MKKNIIDLMLLMMMILFWLVNIPILAAENWMAINKTLQNVLQKKRCQNSRQLQNVSSGEKPKYQNGQLCQRKR